MKQIALLATVELCAALVLLRLAPIRRLHTTPNQVETRIGIPSGGYAFTLAAYAAQRTD